jgi:putative SOS response-associated peptidase YedK
VFGFAGLWDSSRTDDGAALESCTIITMPANPLLAEIHNVKQRMPAILQSQDVDAWLTGSADEARAALKPYPADSMVAWPVSRQVNTPRNNHSGLIAPESVAVKVEKSLRPAACSWKLTSHRSTPVSRFSNR